MLRVAAVAKAFGAGWDDIDFGIGRRAFPGEAFHHFVKAGAPARVETRCAPLEARAILSEKKYEMRFITTAMPKAIFSRSARQWPSCEQQQHGSQDQQHAGFRLSCVPHPLHLRKNAIRMPEETFKLMTHTPAKN